MGGILAAPSAERLRAGELEAVFLPEHGMLCASLRQRGVELLRRVEDLDLLAAKGSSAGIPLLHPWANRLENLRYRALGPEVMLDPRSPLLHLDENGLPLHGVPWSRLRWEVTAASQDAVAARLAWTRPELLAVFPFPHRLELTATLRPDGLRFEITLAAAGDGPVPVSFGFHPYLGLPELPRERWRLRLPARREIRVEFLAGFRCTQVYAPPGKDLVALEPMTAVTNALASGRSLPLAVPGEPFRAAFRIVVGAA